MLFKKLLWFCDLEGLNEIYVNELNCKKFLFKFMVVIICCLFEFNMYNVWKFFKLGYVKKRWVVVWMYWVLRSLLL